MGGGQGRLAWRGGTHWVRVVVLVVVVVVVIFVVVAVFVVVIRLMYG